MNGNQVKEKTFMRKKLLIITFALALPIVSIAGCLGCLMFVHNPMWDGTLMGPYIGVTYEEEVVGEPVSSLNLKDAGLAIYEIEEKDNPVLIIRSKEGDLLSQTLLLPEKEYEDGEVLKAFLKDLRLHRRQYFSQHAGDGITVLITCNWEWGGKEAGLLCLNNDFSFKEMWLSW